MSDHIKASDFDPPLESKQVEQVQEAINEALRRRTVEQPSYPYDEADNVVLGPGVFASKDRKVLNWDGVNYVPQKHAQPQDIKQYKVGDYVEVLKGGDWTPGRVSSKQPGALNVDTERGPITIGSYLKIRIPQEKTND